jgi:hypothetical protein
MSDCQRPAALATDVRCSARYRRDSRELRRRIRALDDVESVTIDICNVEAVRVVGDHRSPLVKPGQAGVELVAVVSDSPDVAR